MLGLQYHRPRRFDDWAPEQRSTVGYTKLRSRPLPFALGAKDWISFGHNSSFSSGDGSYLVID
ncbi:hypothetical protein Trco_006667 [Trichoderma cornu-damae]|uniref:Uncharacterized protein n=1 Tax=Trichoderma cornu-damae TaxID=654480 RepID=A0A9P8QH17_9HYPO|nr:hypothetical protein Trco_006667 [Trichoderma cornu-damae]